MKKYTAIDLFCGAGGLSLGLKKAGFNVKIGLDIDKDALETYRTNFKRTKIIHEDICKIDARSLEKLAGICRGDNFLLAGCPPCQGFSSIGKRDVENKKNQLVYEYLRIIKELEPSFILMENVPGMVKGVGKEIFKDVVRELEKQYFIVYDTLNAADYGVPQLRKRLVLQGIRKDVYKILLDILKVDKIEFLPEPTHSSLENDKKKRWKTVGETIMDLPEIEAGQQCEQEGILNHVARNLSSKNIARLEAVRLHDGNRKDLPKSLELECHKKKNVGYTDTYGIIKLDRPSPTITTGCTSISKGRFGHPTQNRGLSIREAARLQSFDDSFVFCGNIGSMSLQVGNAVPPKLAEVSAKKIKHYMDIYQKYIDATKPLSV